MLSSLRRLMVAFRQFPGRLVLSQVLLLVFATTSLLAVGLNRRLFDEAIPNADTGAVFEIGVWMFLLAVGGAAALMVATGQALFFANATAWGIRTRVYDQLQTLSFENFDRLRTGSILTRLSSDVGNVFMAILFLLATGLLAPMMIVVAFWLIASQTPQFLPIVITVVLAIVVLLAIALPQLLRAFEERQRRLDAQTATLQENLSGMKVVKAFTAEEVEKGKYAARADDLRDSAIKVTLIGATLAPVLAVIAGAGTYFALRSGGSGVIAGDGTTVGDLSATISYLTMLLVPLAALALLVPILLRGNSSAARILQIYDAVPAIAEPSDPAAFDPAAVAGRIVFDNVTFAFRRPDGELDPPVLDGIDLTIEAGQQVGFLGATGAGKSALVNLIPRFYDVSSGTVSIDGVDVRRIPLAALRDTVGIALQEAVLFQGPLRDNLKFGAPDAPDEVMIEAAKAAQSYDFIMDLPNTWDARVERRGGNFSGGQRQRLSMTRALVPQPRILILDDSTSALDAETEAKVQEAIPGFTGGATTLYVAQRISAVIGLDRIVLLDAGRIVDQGSHEELLERCSLYQEIYESQLGASGLTGAAAKGAGA